MPLSQGGTGRQDWQSPPELFNTLHSIFNFTIDGAASTENRLLARYWNYEDNALLQDWKDEIVFINPPFSQTKLFLAKARTSILSCFLFPIESCVTKFFYQFPADHLFVPKRRISYLLDGMQSKPNFGTIIALYGDINTSQLTKLSQLLEGNVYSCLRAASA